MNKKIFGGVVLAILLGTGMSSVYQVSAQTGNQDQVSTNDTHEREVPIIGDDLKRASAAALTHTGSGRVTETEVGDEESYYEVEVSLKDGQQIDVQLDEHFKIVGEKVDNENEIDR